MCKIECASGLMRSIVEWTVSTLPAKLHNRALVRTPIRLEPNIWGVPKILCATDKSGVWRSYRERITRSDLIEALRREGCTSLSRMPFAVLNTDGSITVGLRCDR